MTDNDSLKILRVATDIYPEKLGGGALHAHMMSKRQAERGHDVTVLTSKHGDQSLPARAERDGYRVCRNQELVELFGNSITPGTIRSLATRLGAYDVVHAHSHLYFSTNVAAGLLRLSKTPLVLTNHGLISQTAPRAIQKVYLPTVGRFTFNSADRVLCYTEVDRERLHEQDISAPVSVIHNGIDCSIFRPISSVPTRKQLLYVGRLNEAKGVDRLIQAFEQLHAEFPELSLKIVGDGPMRESLRKLCERREIEDRVTFLGTVPNEELPRVYNESRVFVLPSDAEGLPRTVLESLACGTPVVTSDLTQLESVVEGCGFQVPPESIDELAAAIRRLLVEEDTYEQLQDRAQARVTSDYSWSETVEQTIAVYRELLK